MLFFCKVFTANLQIITNKTFDIVSVIIWLLYCIMCQRQFYLNRVCTKTRYSMLYTSVDPNLLSTWLTVTFPATQQNQYQNILFAKRSSCVLSTWLQSLYSS